MLRCPIAASDATPLSSSDCAALFGARWCDCHVHSDSSRAVAARCEIRFHARPMHRSSEVTRSKLTARRMLLAAAALEKVTCASRAHLKHPSRMQSAHQCDCRRSAPSALYECGIADSIELTLPLLLPLHSPPALPSLRSSCSAYDPPFEKACGQTALRYTTAAVACDFIGGADPAFLSLSAAASSSALCWSLLRQPCSHHRLSPVASLPPA